MKTHFGYLVNEGDYYSPCICVADDKTVCGCTGEEVLEHYTTDAWEDVSCKKCLKLKNDVVAGQKEDEKAIVAQMGDMADFMEAQNDKN